MKELILNFFSNLLAVILGIVITFAVQGVINYGQDRRDVRSALELVRSELATNLEDIVALDVATRPDCLGPEVLEVLAELAQRKPLWVELGLQTIHPETARAIRRGCSLPVFDEAVRNLHTAGAEVIVHQILGLPGETPAQMVETARYIADSGAEGIKLHLLHILDDADMYEDYLAGRVPVMEKQDYFSVLGACLRVLPPDMVIHRLTGDGDKRHLIAPLWSADKKRVLNDMNRYFEQHDVIQGSDWVSNKNT